MPPNTARNSAASKSAAIAAPQDFQSLEDFWQQKMIRQGNPELFKDPREIAREEAEKIRAEAREQAEAIKKEAFEKGFNEGKEQGQAAGHQEYGAMIDEFGHILQELHDQRRTVFHKYEEELLPLIKTMVDRLVNHEVSVNPRVIQACFRESMEFVVENSVVQVHLHSEDFHRIKEASLENPAMLAGKSRVQLVDDPNISQGGCLLKTDFGEIDGTLESCREKLYEAFDRAFLAALAEDNDL